MLHRAFLTAALAAAVAFLAAPALALAQGQPAAAPAPAAPAATAPATAPAADADPLLAENSVVQVRKSDYDLELTRLEPDVRAGFSNNRRRVEELVQRILITKTLAVQARQMKLENDPDVALRWRVESERFWSGARVAMAERAAAAEFDASVPKQEARAKELYLANKAKYTVPEQISASHILFAGDRHPGDVAEKLAVDAQAKIAAGADFNQLAQQLSEDPSAKTNEGRLGYFNRQQFDPAFTEAAFKLQKIGDVSPPVHTRFGWHLIRLDGRQAPRIAPYEDVRDAILAEMKGVYVDQRRDALLNGIRNDPAAKLVPAGIEAVYVVPPDAATIRRMTDEVLKQKAAKPN